MFELAAIMAPFWQVKQGKYYLDEVQKKLSQHMLFYLRLKACRKTKKKNPPSYSLWSLPPTEESTAQQYQKKQGEKKILIVLKLLDVIDIFALVDCS